MDPKLYIFDPSSSITVYELSQILKHIRLMIPQHAYETMDPQLRKNFHEVVHEAADDNYQGA